MIHEVTQAANMAAAIVMWLKASPAAVIHCNYAANINHGFTPPFTQPCCLLQFNKRLSNAQ